MKFSPSLLILISFLSTTCSCKLIYHHKPFHPKDIYTLKNYHLTKIDNNGKKTPVGTLPVLVLNGEHSHTKIEFCKTDVRFNLHGNNIIFDSIKIFEIPLDSVPLHKLTEEDKDSLRGPTSYRLSDILLSGFKKKKPKPIYDTITISSNKLVDIPLLPEMAYLEGVLTHKAVIADSTTKKALINLLNKEYWIEVHFFSKDIYKGTKPQIVNFKSVDFKMIYKSYQAKVQGTPKYKKDFAFKHLASITKKTFLNNISIPTSYYDNRPKKYGFLIDGLSGSDDGEATIVKREKVKRIARQSNFGYSGAKGKRSKANAMRLIRDNIGKLKQIFLQYQKQDPTLKGTIKVTWKINANGVVTFCEIQKSSVQSEAFQNELVNEIRSWDYGQVPYPNDITTVTYPFKFGM